MNKNMEVAQALRDSLRKKAQALKRERSEGEGTAGAEEGNRQAGPRDEG